MIFRTATPVSTRYEARSFSDKVPVILLPLTFMNYRECNYIVFSESFSVLHCRLRACNREETTTSNKHYNFYYKANSKIIDFAMEKNNNNNLQFAI